MVGGHVSSPGGVHRLQGSVGFTTDDSLLVFGLRVESLRRLDSECGGLVSEMWSEEDDLEVSSQGSLAVFGFRALHSLDHPGQRVRELFLTPSKPMVRQTDA